MCSGSMNQFTAIYNGSGDLINHIKYYDGFMGQRVGAISCLAFHPHWVCVPAGGEEGGREASSSSRRGAAARPLPTPQCGPGSPGAVAPRLHSL